MTRPDHPARTLLLTTSYPRSEQDFGGHFVRTHARLERHGAAAVQVLAFGTAEASAGQHPDPGIEVEWLGGGSLFGAPGVLVRLRERPRRALLLAWPLCRALWSLRHRSRYQRVVAHFLLLTGWPLGVWFSRRCRSAPASLEIVAHGSDVRLYERLPRALRQRIASDLRAQGAVIRFVSAELRQRMSRALGSSELQQYVGSQPIAALPLDLPELPAGPSARALLGLDEEDVLVVVVGRLTESKRVSVALAAAELLPAARVVVIGDGPEADALRARHPAARFLGAVERKQALTWMRAADLLISASRLEGAPTVVREARILGLPVVAVSAGDLARWSERDPDLWVV